MRRPLVLAALCGFAASVAIARPVLAQARDNSIDPGMTKAQVIEHLGQPQSMHTSDTLVYLYYKNGCEKTCGMSDLVVLSHDKVVDAIFRDPARHYTGQSSSPASLTPAEARSKATGMTLKTKPDTTSAGKATVVPAPPAAPPAAPPPAPAPAPAAGAAAPKGDSITPPKDSTAAKPPSA